MRKVAFDTETTGIDFHHGSKPFLVTFCNEQDENIYFEWSVDPLTRQPKVPKKDLKEVLSILKSAKTIVGQNLKFDVAGLQTIAPELELDWSKCHDTLIMAHLLDSNRPKDLTTLVMRYLKVDVQVYEDRIKEATNKARGIASRQYPDWQIAVRDHPNLPSAKEKLWQFDMWLPKLVAKEHLNNTHHKWNYLCRDYANADSLTTMELHKVMLAALKERGLYKLYLERLKHMEASFKIEKVGVTVNDNRLAKMIDTFTKESEESAKVCVGVAKSMGEELKLPKGGTNKSLIEFTFNKLKLEPYKVSDKTGTPSLDKQSVDHYLATLPPRSKQMRFIKNLAGKRKRDTALTFLESYKKFWMAEIIHRGWYRLHPRLNITSTATLRCSSSNPNSQQISKQEGFNLRYCFGPTPGREWWSLDAKNIELRIPAYESGEEDMVDLFENPDEPPYYGSNHLMIFDVLHPEKFAKHGADCKKVYASTWYQWTKNGNFAVQYGAIESSGTADAAYHIKGAQKIIQDRFKKVAGLNARMINFANKNGYVETIPDKTIDPDRGYPLQCTRTNQGRILPTVPLNYHVQGTAMWWMMQAMVRCQNWLDELNESKKPEHRAHIVMQVHDELVFDFPKSKIDPREDKGSFRRSNLWKIKKLKSLMEQGGDNIGIPTPVGVDYHPNTWSESVDVGL